ncbi:hypothetical protein M2271_003549 [Streptomyces sp. LBL]|uniref:hypothetical protein n=1 Tax=Streptomyces sp. LBL TaxID=2940562 RepID=UPI0024745666|nr:hypothetical protein [Streptomyces sp. LBL]MDH6625738.1 hypothetical protein [Streptomyces sp. LBL]
MNSFLTYLQIVALRVKVKLQAFAATEPVRLRAALTSLIIAGALYVPILSQPGLAENLGALGAIVLPIVVGETTRAKVTPAQ